jgi:hypothetical protein
MGSLLGVLLPLVPSLIRGIEAIFQTKPKSGPDKMGAAVDALRIIVEKMMVAGVPLPDGSLIQDKSVSDDLLRGMIEAEYQRMKASGGRIEPVPAVSAGNAYVVVGTVTPISLAGSGSVCFFCPLTAGGDSASQRVNGDSDPPGRLSGRRGRNAPN